MAASPTRRRRRIAAAVGDAAVTEVAGSWESRAELVPPPVIWRRTLDEVRALGSRALASRDERPRGRARLRRGAVRR